MSTRVAFFARNCWQRLDTSSEPDLRGYEVITTVEFTHHSRQNPDVTSRRLNDLAHAFPMPISGTSLSITWHCRR